jgi:hypothetical protein
MIARKVDIVPGNDENGSMLALLSVWIALGAWATTVVTMATSWSGKEAVMTLLPYTYALSITLSSAVLWALRRRPSSEHGVAGQRIQSFVAILINSVSVMILLISANGFRYGMAGLLIEIGFLALCYKAYTKLVLRE